MTDREMRVRIGERARRARLYLGLSWEEAGRILRWAPEKLVQIEFDESGASPEELARMGRAYGRDLTWFTADDGTASAPPMVGVEDLDPTDRAELAEFAAWLKHRKAVRANREEAR